VSWPIKHVSVYFLSVHENTPLFFGIKRKKITLPDEENIVDLYNWTVSFLGKHGFGQYEISSFSKPGYGCNHNCVYWEHKPYKGLGLGACSYDGTSRFTNEKNLGAYLKAIEESKDVTVFFETLTPEQVRLEKIMLALRRPEGIAVENIFDGVTQEKKLLLRKKITWLKENNFVCENQGRLSLTPAALAVENEVVVQLSV
jgi:oxygen-independent coproporphyrinogen-3 oxidase